MTYLDKLARAAAHVSDLDKLIALAGQQVPVKAYQRVENGRPQQVRQHMQGHQVSAHMTTAGALKTGNVIQLGSVHYAVTGVSVYNNTSSSSSAATSTTAGATTGTTSGTATGSQGTGVNTSGPASTGSAGAGVNTSPPQAILDAAATAQKLSTFNVPEVRLGLQVVGAKTSYLVYAPRDLKILQVG